MHCCDFVHADQTLSVYIHDRMQNTTFIYRYRPSNIDSTYAIRGGAAGIIGNRIGKHLPISGPFSVRKLVVLLAHQFDIEWTNQRIYRSRKSLFVENAWKISPTWDHKLTNDLWTFRGPRLGYFANVWKLRHRQLAWRRQTTEVHVVTIQMQNRETGIDMPFKCCPSMLPGPSYTRKWLKRHERRRWERAGACDFQKVDAGQCDYAVFYVPSLHI